MMTYNNLELDIDGHVATVWLARANRRNALDALLVTELLAVLDVLEADAGTRVLVLRGRGEVFCAGGDLQWMNSADHLPLADHPATWLSRVFARIYSFSKPVVTCVHGAALGGAMGLVAASDFVIAAEDALFTFTELKLGLIPAVISPFVIARIGEFRARRLMLSARRLSAQQAHDMELVDLVTASDKLDEKLGEICRELLQTAPRATIACKKLIAEVSGKPLDEELFIYTAGQLRMIQAGDEAKAGIQAFFEKKDPPWVEG